MEGDTVYFSAQHGDFYALDVDTGAERWRTSLPANVESAPALRGDTIYLSVAFRDPQVGALLALNASDGSELWSFEPDDRPATSPAVAGDLVIFGDTAGNLYAVDARSGTERWRTSTEGVLTSPIVVAGSTLYTGDAAGNMLAYDAITGDRRWIVRTSRPNNYDPAPVFGPALSGRLAFYAAQSLATVYGVDADNGRRRWMFDATPLGTPPPRMSPGSRFGVLATCSPAASADTVYACISFGELGGPAPDRYGFLYALDAATGEVKWRFEALNEIYSQPVLQRGLLIFASKHGTVHALNPRTGEQLWTFEADGPLHNPVLANSNTLLFGTWAGTFYALR